MRPVKKLSAFVVCASLLCGCSYTVKRDEVTLALSERDAAIRALVEVVKDHETRMVELEGKVKK